MFGRTQKFDRPQRFAIVALIALGGAWWVGSMAPFDIPRHAEPQYPTDIDSDYKPNTGPCSRDRIESLSAGNQQADREAECAKHAEEFRQGQEALNQAFRSANASEEAVLFSFFQTRIAFFQAIFSTLAAIFTGWAAWEASRAAGAANRSVAQAAEHSERALRAYVTVTPDGFTIQQGVIRFEANARLRNSGQTPAYRVIVSARTSILPLPLPVGFQFPVLEWQDDASRSTLGSGDEISTNAMNGTEFPQATLDEVVRPGGGNVALYFWGRVNYEDAFARAHYTEFCSYLVWPIVAPDAEIHPVPMWMRTGRHNHAV